jgi:hypothetical protein
MYDFCHSLGVLAFILFEDIDNFYGQFLESLLLFLARFERLGRILK